ncbi:MAG: WD40 repeat domain-containing protein [Fuerstiella sp.]
MSAEWRVGELGDHIVDVIFDDVPYAITTVGYIQPLLSEVFSEATKLQTDSFDVVEAHLVQPGVFVTKSVGGTATWYLATMKRRLSRVLRDAEEERFFEIAPDAEFYATMSDGGSVTLRWTEGSQPVCADLPVTGRITELAISSDSRYLAVTNEDEAVIVWDLASSSTNMAACSRYSCPF